jgi:hypothetical protein
MAEIDNDRTSADPATELVRAFFDRSRKPRYLALAETGSKGREKLRRSLPHLRDLDARFVRTIPSHAQDSASILNMLRELGAPSSCYVISENADLDNSEMPLHHALEYVVGKGMGTIISCIPGSLAYFEGEGPSDRAVLYRTAV